MKSYYQTLYIVVVLFSCIPFLLLMFAHKMAVRVSEAALVVMGFMQEVTLRLKAKAQETERTK